MTDNERFFKFFDYLKENGKINTQTQLGEIIATDKAGVSDLKAGRKKITIDHIRSMKKSYPELNVDFFMMDDQDMLLNQSSMEVTAEKEFVLRTDRRQDSQDIPIYELSAAASLTTVFQGHPNILGHLKIPNMPKSDGALYVTGDSMYPLLKSGDIAIYRQIRDLSEGIVFGEMHIISAIIDGDITTVIKFIQKSEKGEDWIRLVSQNTYHAPRDIHMSKVMAAALVKGSVRINSMM